MSKLNNFKKSFESEYVILFTEKGRANWQVGWGYNSNGRLRCDSVSTQCPVWKQYKVDGNTCSVHSNIGSALSEHIVFYSSRIVICSFNSDKTITPLIHLNTRKEIQDYYVNQT